MKLQWIALAWFAGAGSADAQTGERVNSLGKVLLGDEVHEARPDQLLSRNTQNAAKAVVHVDKTPARIHDQDAGTVCWRRGPCPAPRGGSSRRPSRASGRWTRAS